MGVVEFGERQYWMTTRNVVRKLFVFCDIKGIKFMNRSKLSFTVVTLLFAVLLAVNVGTLYARDADPASRTFAAG